MEYSFTIQDLQNKTGFSMPLLRKILADILPLMTTMYTKGQKNALMFNSNALIVLDKVKQLKDNGLNLPSIRKELEQQINNNKNVKIDSNSHLNTSINTEHFKDLLLEIKEANEKILKVKDEVIASKEQVIKELQNKVLFITDGKSLEILKLEQQEKQEKLIRLEYELKSKENELNKLHESELKIKEEASQLKYTIENKEKLMQEMQTRQEEVKKLSLQLSDLRWYQTKEKKELKQKLLSLT